MDSKFSGSGAGSKLVFICGLHRSGTSLLYRCIGEHPEASVFSNTCVPENEGQHLQSVYKTAKAHGGPGRFGFDPSAHLTESSALATEENAMILLSEWGPHWELSATCLVEKSPPNLIRMRFLQTLFPDSKFIVLIRHPIAVSYATQKWCKTSLHKLIEHWLVCHVYFKNDFPKIDKIHVVRYEDFIKKPNEVLYKIHDFLEIHHCPLRRSEVRSNMNSKYIQRFEQLSENGIVGRMYHRYVQSHYEYRIRAFGYSLYKGHYVLNASNSNI